MSKQKRIRQQNNRLRSVVYSAIRNGFVACVYCEIKEKGHVCDGVTITHPESWGKSNRATKSSSPRK